jgi:phage host-nuclease inhibitor protein Gam
MRMTKTNKAKTQTLTPAIVTREEMAHTAGEIADLQHELNRLVMDKNEKLAAIEKEYAARIGSTKERLEMKLKASLSWCERNEGVEFKENARTIRFSRADLQFRRGNWAVVFKGGWNNDKVVEALKGYTQPGKPAGLNYVRTVEEVNKEKVREDRKLLTEQQWAALGIRIVQEKSMIVTPHGDDAKNQQKMKEAA